jgi:uroporphyrin-III C-methyltransferase
MANDNQKGKVIIAAAGPGDPELITYKAVQYLMQADLILTDRLVNKEIIRRFAAKKAEVIEVGKQSGKNGSTTQEEINSLMIRHALQNKLVVRLKGGDVSLFSNILDELEALSLNRISYEIIPGVTAALGAAAYAGIPLTARGYATGVRLLTFYKPEVVTNDEWIELGKTSDTLVFYMSSQSLSQLAQRLFEAGMDKNKPVAVIEQATTPVQHVFIQTLEECRNETERIFLSPTLIIIGEVVKLHPRFNWFKSSSEDIQFFEPVGDTNDSLKPVKMQYDSGN